jgi:IS5 family transposase
MVTHTGAVHHLVSMTGIKPERVFVDKGYQGHGHPAPDKVHVAGRIPKRAKRPFRKLLPRRSMIETAIAHMKSGHQLELNFLNGKEGDRIDDQMAPAGYNHAKLLRALGWLEKIATPWRDYVLPLAGVILDRWMNRFLPRIIAF